MKLYKLVDNKLVEIETEYKEFQNGVFVNKTRTEEELQGYKPLLIGEVVLTSVYENSVYNYVETETEITQVYTVEEKTVEEIIEINTEFWNTNYILIENLTETLYIPLQTIRDGSTYDLIKNDLSLISTESATGILVETGLELYSQPDFTQKIDSDYLSILKVNVKDVNQLDVITTFLYKIRNTGVLAPTVV